MEDKIVLRVDGIGITDHSFLLIVNEPRASEPRIREIMTRLQEEGWSVDGKVDTILETKGEKTSFDFTVRGDMELKNSSRGSVYSRGTFECTIEKADEWRFNKISCVKVD